MEESIQFIVSGSGFGYEFSAKFSGIFVTKSEVFLITNKMILGK